MKKLWSLLSVLTISGTAIPTTIAASPYQKEKTIENNLEFLNRNKRRNKINISNISRYKNLGEIKSNDKYTILDTFISYNRNLPNSVKEKLEVTNINLDSAVIYVNHPSPSFSYEGKLAVQFTLSYDSPGNLLKKWSNDYESFIKEFERQKREDFNYFSSPNKRTWIGNKKIQINQLFSDLDNKMAIIQNNSKILKLERRINNLEQELNKLRQEIENLKSKSNAFSLCGSTFGFSSAITNFFPDLGLTSKITGLISASCFLANEFN